MADIEATFQRITVHKGVLGLLIVDANGVVQRSTCDASLTEQYAYLIPQVASLARNMVRDLDPTNDLEFVRIRSKVHEIMVAPRDAFVLIAIQDPSVTA